MKEVSDEVNFLHMDKHESFLQIDTMILMGMVKHCPKVLKIASLQFLYNISKKELEMKLIFCMQINKLIGSQNFLEGDTIIIDGHDQAFSKDPK